MLLLTLFSCSLEPEIGSTVTNYPVITINGGALSFATKGIAYVDKGAVAKEGIATIPVKTTGTVNTNTTGVYKITCHEYCGVGHQAMQSEIIVNHPDTKPQ